MPLMTDHADDADLVRTAAEGASESELGRDVERLSKRWESMAPRPVRVVPVERLLIHRSFPQVAAGCYCPGPSRR